MTFLDFNSIKVRLNQRLRRQIRKNGSNFNSIKVRLNHYDGGDSGEVLGFQFHKGTIKPKPKTMRCINIDISIP